MVLSAKIPNFGNSKINFIKKILDSEKVVNTNIPKSEKRFARQHIYEPPPEFPLASPCSGIVHHLSGPNRYARTQTFHKRSVSVDGAAYASHQLLSLRLVSFPLTDSHTCQTPWSVFQDGPIGNIPPASGHRLRASVSVYAKSVDRNPRWPAPCVNNGIAANTKEHPLPPIASPSTISSTF